MEWNWLQSLLYGLVSGLTEFLPISSEAHQFVFLKLNGLTAESQLAYRLFCHFGMLFAVLFACGPQISKLRRENRLARMVSKRRSRQPNQKTVLESRVLKTAMVPVILSFGLLLLFPFYDLPLWLVAVLLAFNGILLYIPQFFPTGNKDALSMSRADSLLFGIAGCLGRFPGLSGIAATTGMLKIRGNLWQYALELALLLAIPMLLGGVVADIYAMASVGVGLAITQVFKYLLSALAAFVSGYCGIYMMRFLAVKVGFTGFSYYCWGAALLTFLFYLMF